MFADPAGQMVPISAVTETITAIMLLVDELDARILTILQEDGRISNAALAERVKLSPSPCLRRVRRLERDGLIVGYRAVLDRPRAGLGITAFVELKVTGHSQGAAREIEA